MANETTYDLQMSLEHRVRPILIDLDGVVFDYAGGVSMLYNKITGRKLFFSSHKDCPTYDCLSSISQPVVRAMREASGNLFIYRAAPCLLDWRERKWLKLNNERIIYVTARESIAEVINTTYNRLIDIIEERPRCVIYTTDKMALCQSLGECVILEDNLKNLYGETSRGVKKFLIDYVYNNKEGTPSDVTRVSSMQEFISIMSAHER